MNLQLGFSFIAGLLTTLSPCVLPILPFLLGGALRKNKKAPLFMILGLAISFVAVGFTISRFGSLLGFDSNQIKTFSAALLIVTSFFFLSKKIQSFTADKLTSFANLGSTSGFKWGLDESSNWDSVVLGILLGAIWSPCAGPTLGVAVSLASQQGAALQALYLMLVYSFGAALPMLMISYGFRSVFQKYQGAILNLSENSKPVFGTILLLSGLFILLGFDRSVETFLLNHLPQAWVDLITNY